MCMQQGPRAEWVLLGWHGLRTGSQKHYRRRQRRQQKTQKSKGSLANPALRMLSRVSIGWNQRLGKLGSEAALCCLFPAGRT